MHKLGESIVGSISSFNGNLKQGESGKIHKEKQNSKKQIGKKNSIKGKVSEGSIEKKQEDRDWKWKSCIGSYQDNSVNFSM